MVVLLNDSDPSKDRVLQLPYPLDQPPTRVRVPTTWAGVTAFDVYELTSAAEWPERAVYQHRFIDPRSAEDEGLPVRGADG